jgi:hypothetical protein
MELDQLPVVLQVVIVAHNKAPTRRKPDEHSEFH